ncbi:MAG: anaerobic ribonucleoside-triphosphate reductase activating protein [Pseudobdellovibrio sp.]
MRYLSSQITFQEVPDEISLSFLITGCSLKCPGCHSVDSWNPQIGTELNISNLDNLILKSKDAITCVLFMGGEWEHDELLVLLKHCRKYNLKTCLYTGLDDVSALLKQELTYLKTGSWEKNLGGLSSKTTNQKLIELKTGMVLNFHYTAHGGHYGQADI